MSLIIFTGIDEFLSPSVPSESQVITEVVQGLQQQNIPLIPVTSKTRAEIADCWQSFGLSSPLIVEGGSGIFVPQTDHRFSTSGTKSIDNYYLHQLGCSYTEARAALKAVQEEINKILRGFGDMDEENIQSLIGGSTKAARKAKSREFSEYFLTPSRLEIEQLQEVATEYGFKILPGDNLSLVLGAAAGETEAINWLKHSFTVKDSEIHTVGLGLTASDLALLEAVDIPIIIPSVSGIDSCWAGKNWQVANNAGVQGWAASIRQVCAS
jgi:mannosyl-3-phosphoglycerate phosphatase